MRLALLLMAVLLSGCAVPSERGPEVARVIDGDTFELEGGEIVRLLCIDTPEKNSQFYLDAKERLRELIDGKELVLESGEVDKDIYGRSLRYVYADNISVNEQLVKDGLATAYLYNESEECASYLLLEAEAIENGVGIWE